MNIDDLKRLIHLLESSDLEEIEIEEHGRRIRVKKPTSGGGTPTISTQAIPAIESTARKVESAPEEDGDKVTSPFIGTFYLASSPDAEPFVNIGDTVKQGDVVCIVEAMKLMNEIESDRSGTIKKILVENGSPVEFGQPLFIIG